MNFLRFLFFYSLFLYIFGGKTCYEFHIKFGEEECSDISSSLLSELYRGKKCLNFFCTTFFDPLEANICIEKKKHEYKLMIFGKQSNLTFDISTFKHDDPYTIEGLAISGSHFSLLFHDSEVAYRQSYDFKKLQLNLGNTIKLVEIGLINIKTWAPAVDSDYYYETGFKNVAHYLHNNTKMENADITNLQYRCLEWNDSTIYVPDMVTTSLPTISSSIFSSTYISSSDVNAQKSSFTYKDMIVGGIIAAITTAIIVFIFMQLYYKKKENSNQHSVIRYVPAPPTNEQQNPPPAYSTFERVDERMNTLEERLNAIETRGTSENNQQNNSRSQAPEATPLLTEETNSGSLADV